MNSLLLNLNLLKFEEFQGNFESGVTLWVLRMTCPPVSESRPSSMFSPRTSPCKLQQDSTQLFIGIVIKKNHSGDVPVSDPLDSNTDHHFGLVPPDEDDVEVPVILGRLVLVVGNDPGLRADPGEPALLLLVAVSRARGLEGRGAVGAVLLALGELLGGLPAAQLLLQPSPR